MTYDPATNPRALHAVDKDAQAEFESTIGRLEHDIDRFNRQLSMFRSAGWKDIATELEQQLTYARNALQSEVLNTMESVAFVRGQIRAFQYLLALEQAVSNRREAASTELKTLRSAES